MSLDTVAPSDPSVRDALYEFHQYLSDQIAPLMVADSMEVVFGLPVPLVAAEAAAWTEQQRLAVADDVSTADLLYHAVKKVSLMGEFEFFSKEPLARYVRELGDAVLEYCPDDQQTVLRQHLERLGKTAAVFAPPAGMLHRPSGRGGPEELKATLTGLMARGLRRLSLFMERLHPDSPTAAPEEKRPELTSQFLAAAAAHAASQKELDSQLAPLRRAGIATDPDAVFRTLAQTLAGWGSLPRAEAATGVPSSELGAMRRIVALAEDPAEQAKRFRALVHAGIEQFNGGYLGRAVSMFELAEELVAEGKVQAVFVDALRDGGHEYLDAERLRKAAERPDLRPALRTVLGFFKELQPDGLLRRLNGELNRERRHHLLGLLEVHGAPARARALELLRASLQKDAEVDPFFQMNLVYLLRVIPHPEGAAVDEEVALVTSVPGKSSPAPLVKQVIAYLAATRHEKAERALVTYLRVFENMLLQPETASYDPAQVEVLLDRVCAALARYGSARAWRTLVEHGLKAEVRLGSTLPRLAEAGRCNLSSTPDVVERLLAALKAELPRSVLGITVKRNDERIACLIQALSGTPLADVSQVFQEIAEKHSGQRIAEVASRGLAALRAAGKPEPPAGLSGDLELFGLPGVLQTLAQPQLTGVLSLVDAEGQPRASVLLEGGRFRGARYGRIRGEEALYQLFERPFPGTFAFVTRPDVAAQEGAAPLQEILPLILEGVRRHDEFRRAAALVPDGARLATADLPHTPLADEDEDFVLGMWAKASAGATAEECETEFATDGYRVRRLLAHWVEEGALALGAAA